MSGKEICEVVGCEKQATKTLKEVMISSDPWVDIRQLCDECYEKYQDPKELETANKLMDGDEATIEEIKKEHPKLVGKFADKLNEALQGTGITVEHKGVSFVLRGDESMAQMKITERVLSLLQKK